MDRRDADCFWGNNGAEMNCDDRHEIELANNRSRRAGKTTCGVPKNPQVLTFVVFRKLSRNSAANLHLILSLINIKLEALVSK